MLYKILFVDDETANLRVLERLFRNTYEVINAASGTEALELLTEHDVAVIISDQRMPGMTGIEFLKRAAEMRPQTVRIILTGYTDATALVEAINSGVVYKYVTKPWVNEDLQQTVKRALQHYETTKAQRQLQLQNERLQSRLKMTRDSFVEAITVMAELRSPNSLAHVERTREHAVAVGASMGLEGPDLERLSLMARLHEAAMIHIPNAILHKDSPYSDADHGVIRQHFEPGLAMLENVPDFAEIASALRFFFEHYDGSGQQGFAHEQIPLHARILAVADAYDTMTFPRSARAALSHEAAVALLAAEAGGRFDPEVVNAFMGGSRVEREVDDVLELTLA